jgi:hypothetical protein
VILTAAIGPRLAVRARGSKPVGAVADRVFQRLQLPKSPAVHSDTRQ